MSDIYNKLPPEIQSRYVQKIAVIRGYDPYTFTKDQYLNDVKDFPKVWLLDISAYFVHSHNPYCTDQQLKAFKSLQAYKYYDAGFIENMNCVKVDDNFIVLAEVC